MIGELIGRRITKASVRALAAGLLTAGMCTVQAAPITGQGTWESTLLGRDASGNAVDLLVSGAPNPVLAYVYDTRLDLTWLANWNANGAMTWQLATAWAAGLTDFGGGWSLPGVLDIGGDGCNYGTGGTDCGYNVYGSAADRHVSPLAHMYYDTLGNLGAYDTSGTFQPGYGLSNTGPFSNMQPSVYWSGTAYAPSPSSNAWYFYTGDGDQYLDFQGNQFYAVAVRPGDVLVSAVPEPGTLALALGGLGVLGLARRRWRAH